jgi:hypothetical protein
MHLFTHWCNLQMVNPAIQNDFSYYRRSMARMKQKGENADTLLAVRIVRRVAVVLHLPVEV